MQVCDLDGVGRVWAWMELQSGGHGCDIRAKSRKWWYRATLSIPFLGFLELDL